MCFLVIWKVSSKISLEKQIGKASKWSIEEKTSRGEIYNEKF